jgi:branched-chain amino acid transport system ATP-binding protein
MSAQPVEAPFMLQAQAVTAGFGPTTVLHGIDLVVPRGEVTGIFGLNGAGKSVTMKVLAGVVPVRSGRVLLDGRDVTRLSAEERVRAGMAHVPQGRQVFGNLTVEENLRLGAWTLRRRDPGRYPAALDGVYDRFPILRERRTQLAGTMSGGQQAQLAVGRALVTEPSIILIDEPSAGLSPVAVQDLFATLTEVAHTGVTMLLVEQNVAFGLRLVQSVNLLQVGRVVHSGPVSSLDAATLASRLGVGSLLSAGVGASLAARTTATRKTVAPKAAPKPPAKKAVPKKAVPKKAVPKKAAPKKAAPKKAAPKKAAPTRPDRA